jgi:hypothetical protein
MATQKSKRPREELLHLLKGQIRALEASAKNFDAGEEWESGRLATTIFNLVHDGGPIISLLSQLEVKDSLKFVSSGRMPQIYGIPAPTVATPSLLIVRMDSKGARFVPKLGDGPPTYKSLPFEHWWKNELIYQEVASGQLNRMRLVYALRHQDGGSHIGALTDEIYVHLKKGASWQLTHSDGKSEPVSNLVAASMRQVAWEVTETLKQLGGDLQ